MGLDEHQSYTYIISSRMVKSDRNEIEFLSSKQGANIFLTFNDFCNKIYFPRHPQRLKWMLKWILGLFIASYIRSLDSPRSRSTAMNRKVLSHLIWYVLKEFDSLIFIHLTDYLLSKSNIGLSNSIRFQQRTLFTYPNYRILLGLSN